MPAIRALFVITALGAFSFAVGASVSPHASAGLAVGDATCDGTVDPVDAAVILQFWAGLIPTVSCPRYADADLSGSIDPIDATLILQLSAGLVSSLPPETEVPPSASETPLSELPTETPAVATMAPTATAHPPTVAPTLTGVPTNAPTGVATSTDTPAATVTPKPTVNDVVRCAQELYDWAQSSYTSLIAELNVEIYCGSNPDVFTGGSQAPVNVDLCAAALSQWALSEFTSQSFEADVGLWC